MNEVIPGKIYRHFKGNYYFVENVALDCDTLERLVIYRTIYENEYSKIWVRKESNFLSEIDANKQGNITGQKHRFELCEELGIDYTKNK